MTTLKINYQPKRKPKLSASIKSNIPLSNSKCKQTTNYFEQKETRNPIYTTKWNTSFQSHLMFQLIKQMSKETETTKELAEFQNFAARSEKFFDINQRRSHVSHHKHTLQDLLLNKVF